MIGVQIPILVAIFEYTIILAMKKYQSSKGNSVTINVGHHKTNEKCDWILFSNKVDKWTFFGTLVFTVTFNIICWSVALNLK